MSDTPRTDAAAEKIKITCDDSCAIIEVEKDGKVITTAVVDAADMAQLERELNEAKEQIERLARLNVKQSASIEDLLDTVARLNEWGPK